MAEQVFQANDGVEVAVHRAAMLKVGTVALQIHDQQGNGATAYLTPEAATQLAEAITFVAVEG